MASVTKQEKDATMELSEEILNPTLRIVDPHHHLWDRAIEALAALGGSRYLLDELLMDLDSGHDVCATVYVEAASMYRADGPSWLRPMGETEFANGVAAMSASGLYGTCRVCAGIVSHADLRLGEHIQDVLEAHIGQVEIASAESVKAPRGMPTPPSSARLEGSAPVSLRIAVFVLASSVWRRSVCPLTHGSFSRKYRICST